MHSLHILFDLTSPISALFCKAGEGFGLTPILRAILRAILIIFSDLKEQHRSRKKQYLRSPNKPNEQAINREFETPNPDSKPFGQPGSLFSFWDSKIAKTLKSSPLISRSGKCHKKIRKSKQYRPRCNIHRQIA